MMKYCRLSTPDLEALHQEFAEFLAINGVDGPAWKEIKANRKADAEKMLDLFSDSVWEASLRTCKFLEVVSPQFIHTYQCLEDKMVLVALENQGSVDFTQLKDWAILEQSNDLKVYTANKAYTKERALELFEMIQKGAVISDGSTFKKLSLLL